MMREIVCKTCGSIMGYVRPGSVVKCCHVCGGKAFDIKIALVTPVYDDEGDKLITECTECGGKVYHIAPLVDPSESVSPILADEIHNLYTAVCWPPYEHRPFFCPHCGSQKTKTAWYHMSFRIDSYLTGTEQPPRHMHDTKVMEKFNVQPKRIIEAMELSWDVLESFSGTIWNYGGITAE